jgi:hypothetical protein
MAGSQNRIWRSSVAMLAAAGLPASQAASMAQAPGVLAVANPCAPVALCPNYSRALAARRAPPPPPPPPPPAQQGGGHEAEIAAAMILLIGAEVAVGELTGGKWVKPEELDRDGPRFPKAQALGRFEVQGYAAPGWPFALDLETLPETQTWLELRYKGSHKSFRVDVPEGRARRLVVLKLPGPAEGGIGVARYTIHSALVRPGEEPIDQPLLVYGIGAGPYAVGSLYLSVPSFGPTRAAAPQQVNYAILAKRTFPEARAEILQLPRQGNKLTLISAQAYEVLGGEQRGNWGAMPPGKKPPKQGAYVLQVRAWRTQVQGSDWTGAVAPNYVFLP